MSASNPTPEEMVPLFQVLTSYLLFERENETQLRTAFAATIQERHHHFHDKDEDKETEFSQCGNEICVKALGILQNARKPRIEVNQFSVAMIDKFNLRIEKSNNALIAYLEEKSLIQKPDDHNMTGVQILEA